MDDKGKTAVAFLLGALVGGALGVLFAPKAGKETRDDLKRLARKAEEKLERKKRELKDAIARRVSAGDDGSAGTAGPAPKA